MFLCSILKGFVPGVVIIDKPVYWFAQQIDGLVYI